MTAPPFDAVKRVRVGDIDIAYVDIGVDPGGGAVPIVLVHGFACGMRMWKRVIAELAPSARVIALDLRGHGSSGAPEDAAQYSAAHLGRDLLGFVDALGLARIDLVGFSLGGGPALAVALTQPQRVRRLVLADVGSGAENPWALTRLAQIWADHGRRGGWDALAPEMLRGEFFKHLARRGPSSRRYMDALLRQHPLHGVVHTLEQVLARRKSLFRMRGRLAAVKVPTLVLTGAEDFVCAKSARLLSANIPGARSAKVPGGSHMVPVERARDFATEVARFLA